MAHPENRYIQSIHRLLKPLKQQHALYYAKVQMAGNNGWPDCYYSSTKGDLWAEYKYVPEREFPKRDTTRIPINLSQNQRQWLAGRADEGRNVCVIVGSPYGGVFLRWPVPENICRADFIHYAVDNHQIAAYIRGEILNDQ